MPCYATANFIVPLCSSLAYSCSPHQQKHVLPTHDFRLNNKSNKIDGRVAFEQALRKVAVVVVVTLLTL